jgi:hypothetical protein
MLDIDDLHTLNRWCSARRLCWQPARTDAGAPAVLLLGRFGGPAWAGLLLASDDDGFVLLDAVGERLAEASDLLALLDALDAGIGRPRPAVRIASPWQAAA